MIRGRLLRKETRLDGPKIVRFLIGNPVIMKEVAKHLPDAGTYAPVTVLIDERVDGVYLSYVPQEQILSDNFAAARQARLAWPTSSAYEDISAPVGNIAVPTLVLAGDKDRQDPLERHEREVLPRIPGAKIKVIPSSGHLIPIDQPGELADSIRSFVQTLASPIFKST